MLPGLGRHCPLRDRAFSYKYTPSPNPNSNYRQWDNTSMLAAMNAVIYQGMSVSKASEVHGIPKTTLDDHVKGRVLPGTRSGPPTLLSSDEEQDLVSFLVKSAEIGCGRTTNEVLEIVERMLVSKGQQRTVTNGWWVAFSRRHPELSLTTPATLSIARAKASSKESINHYFDILQQTFDENDLNDQPAAIFNMDETGCPLDPKPLKCVHVRGKKNPCSISSGSKSQVTVGACVSAAGQCVPPMVVWSRKTMKPELAVGEVPGAIYGFSSKGWMDSRLFHLWFERHFLRYAPAVHPLY